MRRLPLAILFVVLAAAAVGVFTVVSEPSPERLITRAFRQLADVHAVSMKVTASAYAPASLSGGTAVPVVIGGAVHASIPKEKLPSVEAAFSILGSGGGEHPDVSFEARALEDGSAFVKFDGLSSAAGAKADLAELNGQWYAMPGRELAALLSGSGDVGPGFGKEDGALAWGRIRSVATSGELFAYGGRMPNEIIDGVPMRHFALLLDRAGAATLAKDVRAILLGRPLRGDEEDAIVKGLATRQAGVEVWINKRTGNFHKMTLILGAATAGKDDDVERKNVVIEFQAFPEAGGIDAPADTKPFADVASRIFKPTK